MPTELEKIIEEYAHTISPNLLLSAKSPIHQVITKAYQLGVSTSRLSTLEEVEKALISSKIEIENILYGYDCYPGSGMQAKETLNILLSKISEMKGG